MTRTFALVLLVILSGCGGPEPVERAPEPPETARPESPRGTGSVGGDVVATVEGGAITVAEVAALSRELGIPPREALRRLEDELVLSRLAASSAAADDPSVERAARRAAVRALLAREIEAGREPESVSIEDVEARRAEIDGMLHGPEARRASHALVALPPDASEARVDAALRLAGRILAEVRGHAEPSAALDAFAGPQGGLEVSVEHLPAMTTEELDPQFAAALFAAPSPGLLDAPVRSSYGVHVVVLEEIVPPWEVPREEWLGVIQRQLAAERRAQALEELASRLAERTPIAIDPGAVSLAESVPLDGDRGALGASERR